MRRRYTGTMTSRTLFPVLAVAGCADTHMDGVSCEAEEVGAAIGMTETSSVGASAEELSADLADLSLPVTWTDGPFTGADTLTLATSWSAALDVDAATGCVERAGVYVQGSTALSSASGALAATGTIQVWFPQADPSDWRFVAAEYALPLEANPTLEEEADRLYGDSGERQWMSAWLDGRDQAGVDASYTGEDVAVTGHVLVGTLDLGD